MTGFTEDALQRAVARYLDLALPMDAVWWHTPNGGGRSKAEAGRFKAQGVKAGVADCIIIWGGRPFAIELKVAGGYPTPAQRLWRAAFEAAGGAYAVCRSPEEVEATLAAWGVALRARIDVRSAA